MCSKMKTTLQIDDKLMLELKRESARQGRTVSDLVETALRNLMREQKGPAKLTPLPTFQSGGAAIDVSDREALCQATEPY